MFTPYNLKSLDKLPEIQWLVDDVIPKNSMAVMYGKPASCKTFIAIDLCLRMINSMYWQNYTTNEDICEDNIILYFAAEGIHGFKSRIQAWHQYHDIEMTDKFYLIPFSGYSLYENDKVEEIIKLGQIIKAKHKKKISLIVIDTLARAAAGLDENSSKDMGIFIQKMDYIKNKLDTSMLLIHHCGKDISAGMRGSSSLLGAVDTCIKLMRYNETVRFIVEKQKDGDIITVDFKLHKHEKSLVPIHMNEIKETEEKVD